MEKLIQKKRPQNVGGIMQPCRFYLCFTVLSLLDIIYILRACGSVQTVVIDIVLPYYYPA
jgi:hypothetical protein